MTCGLLIYFGFSAQYFFHSAMICINMFGVSANVQPIFPMFVTYLIINWLQDIYLTAKRVNVSYENKIIYENI